MQGSSLNLLSPPPNPGACVCVCGGGALAPALTPQWPPRHLFCLYVSMASAMGSWWAQLAPAMYCVILDTMSSVSCTARVHTGS